MNYWEEVLSIYKIEFWCELTIATTYLGKCGSLFGQKYTLISRFGGGEGGDRGEGAKI